MAGPRRLLFFLEREDQRAQPCRGLTCRHHVGAEPRRQRRGSHEERRAAASEILSPAVEEEAVNEPPSEIQRGPPEPHGPQETLEGHGVRRAPPALVLRNGRPLHPREPGKVRLSQVEHGPEDREHPAKRSGLPGSSALPYSRHLSTSLCTAAYRERRTLAFTQVVPEREKNALMRVRSRALDPLDPHSVPFGGRIVRPWSTFSRRAEIPAPWWPPGPGRLERSTA